MTPSSDGPSLRHLLYLLGALVALWGLVQMTAFVPPAEGADDTETSTAASPGAGSPAPQIEVFTWGNAGAVLLLMGVGGYALYLRQRGDGSTANTAFQSVERLALGQSQELRLIACGDEVLLVGVTDEEVRLLKSYPPDLFEEHPGFSTPDEEAGDRSGKAYLSGASTDFGTLLKQVVRGTRSA